VPLHTLVHAPARRALRVIAALYFRRVEIEGAAHRPARGPALLAATHPGSITDAFLLALAAGRPVRFLAHSGLFARSLQARLLRGAGVIPVYRSRDAANAREQNAATYRAVTGAFAAGDAVGIFPEGVSDPARRVQPIKTGAARMALAAEDAHGFTLGVRLAPVGILFENRRKFRSRVLISFGPPLAAAGYGEAYRRDPEAAVRRLTDDLERALEARVVHVERGELEDLVARVERVYRHRLLATAAGAEAASTFAREQALSREIARAADLAAERDPLLLWRVQRLLEAYERALTRARLSPQLLEAGPPSWSGATLRLVAVAVLGLPVATWGVFWNWLPYRLTGILADRKEAGDTKRHWYQASYGTLLYVLYYPPLLYAAGRIAGPAAAVVLGASLLPTGLFARWYARHLGRERERLRFAVLAARRRYYAQDLRRLRERVLREMDKAVRQVQALRAEGAAGPETEAR
jgi:1-acyl-sn-glycerol-3-phosphate acyltransferase